MLLLVFMFLYVKKTSMTLTQQLKKDFKKFYIYVWATRYNVIGISLKNFTLHCIILDEKTYTYLNLPVV